MLGTWAQLCPGKDGRNTIKDVISICFVGLSRVDLAKLCGYGDRETSNNEMTEILKPSQMTCILHTSGDITVAKPLYVLIHATRMAHRGFCTSQRISVRERGIARLVPPSRYGKLRTSGHSCA